MAGDIYEEFLRLTGFEEVEIPEYLPEWRKASEKLGLTEDDVRVATRERIPDYFDVKLRGARKMLGYLISENGSKEDIVGGMNKAIAKRVISIGSAGLIDYKELIVFSGE